MKLSPNLMTFHINENEPSKVYLRRYGGNGAEEFAFDMAAMALIILEYIGTAVLPELQVLSDRITALEGIPAQILDLDGRLVGTDAVAAQALIDAASAYSRADLANMLVEDQQLVINDHEARLDVLEA